MNLEVQREGSVFSLTNSFLMLNMLSDPLLPVEGVWGSAFPRRLEGTSLPHPPATEQHIGPLEGGISAQQIQDKIIFL